MFSKKPRIDLPKRRERRFVIPSAELFLDELKSHVELVQFSDRPFVETIYFNNDEHEVPFGTTIKARRYVASLKQRPELDAERGYFLEIKRGTGQLNRKIRMSERPLPDIEQYLTKKFNLAHGIRPYVASCYRRRHFRLRDEKAVRITLDTDVCLYYFPPGEVKSVLIGEEKFPRVEIKEKKPNTQGVSLIEKVLADAGAYPVISKKFNAYTHLWAYRDRLSSFKPVRELPAYEYEAKFSTESEKVFFDAKDFFRESRDDFQLSREFPCTVESSDIVHFYRSNGRETSSMAYHAGSATYIHHSSKESFTDSQGVRCIVKRKGRRGSDLPLWSTPVMNGDFIGEMGKNKKRFFVEQTATGRVYAFTLDFCTQRSRKMYQIEVEYRGRDVKFSNHSGDEQAILNDLSAISKLILHTFLTIQPTILTKGEWIEE